MACPHRRSEAAAGATTSRDAGNVGELPDYASTTRIAHWIAQSNGCTRSLLGRVRPLSYAAHLLNPKARRRYGFSSANLAPRLDVGGLDAAVVNALAERVRRKDDPLGLTKYDDDTHKHFLRDKVPVPEPPGPES